MSPVRYFVSKLYNNNSCIIIVVQVYRGVGAVAARPAIAAPLLVEIEKLKLFQTAKNEEKKFKIAVLRGQSLVLYMYTVLAFDNVMYMHRLCQCVDLQVQAKEHKFLRTSISGLEVTSYSAIMYLYMAVSSRVRVGICVYSVDLVQNTLKSAQK